MNEEFYIRIPRFFIGNRIKILVLELFVMSITE